MIDFFYLIIYTTKRRKYWSIAKKLYPTLKEWEEKGEIVRIAPACIAAFKVEVALEKYYQLRELGLEAALLRCTPLKPPYTLPQLKTKQTNSENSGGV